MTKEQKSHPTEAESKKRHEREVEAGAGGAIAGAAIGSVAGPPGAAVGAVVGAIAGAIAGAASETQGELDAAEERKLDEEIGVSGGELGAPKLKHPQAKRGAYSAESSGAGSAASTDEEPAEGPIQSPE
jgi:hypothetical protein